MPRPPRLAVTDLPLHVVQRGHNRERCFFAEGDYVTYLAILRDAAEACAVTVHAYALMTNHVHLLVTPRVPHAVSEMLKSVGVRYVRHVNGTQGRRGTLWEGRHHACLVATDGHLLRACRYIDLNPVRAGMVAHPGEYRWSSYRALSGHAGNGWLVPHPALAIIGPVPGPAYAAWCACGVADDELAAIREATQKQQAYG
ncbi:MAG: transposase [Burkholderiales bacterium]